MSASKKNEMKNIKDSEDTKDNIKALTVEGSTSSPMLSISAGGTQRGVNCFFAAAKQSWIMLIPFFSTFVLLRVSPMMYDGWAGPFYYNQYGGLLSWTYYIFVPFRNFINGRVASNYICGILESFFSEIPLDVIASLVIGGILLCVIQLFHVKKRTITACLFTVFVIFMPYSLRVYTIQIALMQFLTPVLFLLLALSLAGKHETTGQWKYIWWLYPLSAIACTWMENTSIAYGVIITAICIRLTVKYKRVDFRLVGVVLLSLISGIFMMTAPGMFISRAPVEGIQFFFMSPKEHLFVHISTFFSGFIYSGNLAGCSFALILLIAAASNAASRWKKRGFSLRLVLCVGNLVWTVSAFILGWLVNEFSYTATLFEGFYYKFSNHFFVMTAACVFYVMWILVNALVLCGPDWNVSMVCIYGICLLLVVLPTNQAGVRIYAPYYLVMCILVCAIFSYNTESIFSRHAIRNVLLGTVLCLCVLALDFQVQLCARISRVQADRMHYIGLLRDEQLLGHSTSDYYLVPVFNERDAYLGGATSMGTFHYPQFLERYGLRLDTKLVFTNEDHMLVSDQVESSSFRVCVVHQQGREYLYDYIVSVKKDSSKDYTEIFHKETCPDSSYQITALDGEGWYQVKVILTDSETGEQIMLDQVIEQYLYEG